MPTFYEEYILAAEGHVSGVQNFAGHIRLDFGVDRKAVQGIEAPPVKKNGQLPKKKDTAECFLKFHYQRHHIAVFFSDSDVCHKSPAADSIWKGFFRCFDCGVFCNDIQPGNADLRHAYLC